MKKMAIGMLTLLVVAGGLVAPAAAQLQTGDVWGWMYLSHSETKYQCDTATTWGPAESRSVYMVIEAPGWGPGDAYLGFEFGMDYPASLIATQQTLNSPGGVVLGNCTGGRCSLKASTGLAITDNPYAALKMDFFTVAAMDNIVFQMTPDDLPGLTPPCPAWLYYDASNPPIIRPQQGDNDLMKPAWQRAFVIFNYVPVPGDPFLETNPCERLDYVPASQSSWGALKAGFEN